MKQMNASHEAVSQNNKKNWLGVFIGAFVIMIAIGLSLFRHLEISGETFGYWFFARIFAQTGQFIIIDRGPLYVFYLNLFRWMGYPSEIVVEYMVTSLIAATALIILLKRYIGLFLAVFAALLWIPFIQIAEPKQQGLALACICLSVVVRDIKISRLRLAISYALFGCAYMLRPNYLIFIFVFAIGDTISFLRHKKIKNLLRVLRPSRHDWPIFLVLSLFMWFSAMQSSHRWNNSWFASTDWFPNSGKTLRDTAFAHAFPWHYIAYKYGDFTGKDIYFASKEAFGDAKNAIEAIRANPRFIAIASAINIRAMIRVIANHLTMAPTIPEHVSNYRFLYYLIAPLYIAFVLAIFYGAWRVCKSRTMALFFISTVLFVGSIAIVMPKARYAQPFVIILVLSAFWYGSKIRNILDKKHASSEIKQRLILTCSYLVIPVFLVFLSNGLTGWSSIVRDVASDIKKGELRIMQNRGYSLRGSFKSIQSLIKGCHGVLSLEDTFVGAFVDIPIDKVYDIWEIPPFGNFSNSSYNGLRPERIDCVLVSNTLATDIGLGTNCQLRYENYIKPYVKKLQDMGARVYNIEGFGQAIILNNKIH